MKCSAPSKLLRLFYAPKHSREKGFTLIELLVVTVISGGIVATLLFVVVQLLGVDQRESARSETQREMQMAMDYISTELREAVFVYSGTALDRTQGRQPNPSGTTSVPLTNFLPADLRDTNSLPVLAFWKHQPLPDTVRTAQCNGSAIAPLMERTCRAGSSYTLVVYSLNVGNTGTWQGGARITRYALSQFNAAGNPQQGYVNPWDLNNNFAAWPYGMNTVQPSAYVDLQASASPAGAAVVPGRPPNNLAAVLVDFVDNAMPSAAITAAADAERCPTGYDISPPNAWLPAAPAAGQPGFRNPRSFYACVRTGTTGAGAADTSVNQDVLLYLQGNANGRPGAFNNDFRPALQTRVLARGILGRTPGE